MFLFFILNLYTYLNFVILTQEEVSLKNWELVQIGMTKDQLLSVMGAPMQIACIENTPMSNCFTKVYFYRNVDGASGNISFWLTDSIVTHKSNGLK